MKDQLAEREIRNSIVDAFKKKRLWYRKELIDKCLRDCGYTKETLADRSLDGVAVKLKARVGSIISKMIDGGELALDPSKQLYATSDPGIVLRSDEIRSFIIGSLTSAPTAKKHLFSGAESHFGTDKTESRKDDNELRSAIGNMLSRLISEGVIERGSDGRLRLVPEGQRAELEGGIDSLLGISGSDSETYSRFIQAINIRGGEFFEFFSVSLLRSYFESRGNAVAKSEVTGGSDDGGIDGIIDTTDLLGYREKIYIQSKNRRKIKVTLREVRGFYGALCAYGGSRGIFITTSSLHRDAEKFVRGVDNLIAIDGEKLYNISKETSFGVISDGNGMYHLDPKLFNY